VNENERRRGAAIGIDIGGTTIRGVVVGEDGAQIQSGTRPTPSTSGPSAVLTAMLDVLAEALDIAARRGDTVAAVGVGAAGVVDANGTIRSATGTIAGWAGADVRGAVMSITGPNVLVRILNDAHAIAVGEIATMPPGHDAVVVAIGTGIGGAVIHHGELVIGRTGTAGSLGHLSVRGIDDKQGTRPCSCGGVDHLEAHGAGPAIAADYARRAGLNHVPALQNVAAAANRGDQHATAAIHAAASTTGRTLAGLVNTLDPHLVILGGGVTAIGPLYLDPLVSSLRAEALPGPAEVEIRRTTGGSAAVAAGAARAAVSNIGNAEATSR
jgi:glucokinase